MHKRLHAFRSTWKLSWCLRQDCFFDGFYSSRRQSSRCWVLSLPPQWGIVWRGRARQTKWGSCSTWVVCCSEERNEHRCSHQTGSCSRGSHWWQSSKCQSVGRRFLSTDPSYVVCRQHMKGHGLWAYSYSTFYEEKTTFIATKRLLAIYILLLLSVEMVW